MAAGLGFKTFTTGEVLTAGDVNGYLMQGINVFASSAARASAITSPQEGQYSFLKDTNALEYYDGAAWVGAPVGDITAVTAGTGISGGGSSGAVTITNSMATEISAKGDLIAGTGAATFDNLVVGANDTVLTADSSTATGLKWAAPASSGGMTLLSTTSLSGSSVTISSISGSYTNLQIVMKGAYASGDSDLFIRLNGDTGSNYAHYSMQTNDTAASGFYADSATQVQIGFVTGTNTYNQRTSFVLDLPRYTDTSNCFGISTLSTYAFSGRRQIQNFFRYNNSAAITSFTIYPSSGTFSGGSLYIYGVK